MSLHHTRDLLSEEFVASISGEWTVSVAALWSVVPVDALHDWLIVR